MNLRYRVAPKDWRTAVTTPGPRFDQPALNILNAPIRTFHLYWFDGRSRDISEACNGQILQAAGVLTE